MPETDHEHTDVTFAFSERAPSLEALDVKRRTTRRFLGEPTTFAVIGSSHYVGSTALGYHELCSCEPIPDADHRITVPLERGRSRVLSFETDALRVETRIEGRGFDAFVGPDADLSYEFGPGAYTTIDLTADGYETYHTYPEFDLALYTETTFDRREAVTGPSLGRRDGARATEDAVRAGPEAIEHGEPTDRPGTGGTVPDPRPSHDDD